MNDKLLVPLPEALATIPSRGFLAADQAGTIRKLAAQVRYNAIIHAHNVANFSDDYGISHKNLSDAMEKFDDYLDSITGEEK